MKKLFLSLFSMALMFKVMAQAGVGIGTTSPHSSAALHVNAPSANKGMLIPRLTTTQRNTITTPAEGLIIYNSSTDAFNYYDGSNWIQLIPTPSKFNLNMGGNKITNLANGTNNNDAVNKSQLDTKISNAGNSTGNSSIKIKVVEIGDWNMMTTSTVFVPHGLPDKRKIRSIDLVIRTDDPNVLLFPWKMALSSSGSNPIWTSIRVGIDGNFPTNDTNIILSRETGSNYQGTEYDATGYNRGWLTIIYEE